MEKSKTTITSILLILFGTLLISISAQIKLNLPLISTNIPGTWQTFAVLLFAYANKPQIATWAVIFYLLLGGLGFPVFADGSAGYSVLIGKTGGYLFAFVIAAFVVSLFGKKQWTKSFAKSLLVMTLGTSIILLLGVSYLATFIGIANAITYGFVPFILGAIIKITLGAATLPLFYSLMLRNK
jgi:biotin transport system substrate-specific component